MSSQNNKRASRARRKAARAIVAAATIAGGIVLVSGANKAAMLHRVLDGHVLMRSPEDGDQVALLHRERGNVDLLAVHEEEAVAKRIRRQGGKVRRGDLLKEETYRGLKLRHVDSTDTGGSL